MVFYGVGNFMAEFAKLIVFLPCFKRDLGYFI